MGKRCDGAGGRIYHERSSDVASTATTVAEYGAFAQPRPHKRCVHRRHGLAAILTMMACDEQGIELQQSVACCGVVMTEQSNPYAARATARSAIAICLVNRISE